MSQFTRDMLLRSFILKNHNSCLFYKFADYVLFYIVTTSRRWDSPDSDAGMTREAFAVYSVSITSLGVPQFPQFSNLYSETCIYDFGHRYFIVSAYLIDF